MLLNLIVVVFALVCRASFAAPVEAAEPVICPICLNGICGEEGQQLSCCGNHFHRSCLKIAEDHGHKKCPMCRSLLFSSNTMTEKLIIIGDAFHRYGDWIDIVRAEAGWIYGSYEDHLKYRLLKTLSNQASVNELRSVHVAMMVFQDNLSVGWHEYLKRFRFILSELSLQLQTQRTALVAQIEDHVAPSSLFPNINFILGLGKYKSVSSRYLNHLLSDAMKMSSKCLEKLSQLTVLNSEQENNAASTETLFVRNILRMLVDDGVLTAYHSINKQRELIVRLFNSTSAEDTSLYLRDLQEIGMHPLCHEELEQILNDLQTRII